VPRSFTCRFLDADVELTDEREAHIAERHPDLLPARIDRLADTLAELDAIYRGRADDIVVFSRWYDADTGKHLLVFVVREEERSRYWILTARYSRVPVHGEVLWARS
jgi:hypothetical protein